MKTLKLFIVLCFVTATSLNTVNAQNRVVKDIWVHAWSGCQYWDCINEYIDGYADVQVMYMENKWSIKVKKFTVVGYIDECKTLSTNVYECMENQEVNNNNTQNHMVVKQNGKPVLTYRYTLRVDEKTGNVTFENEEWNCH
jgi:hypothetical protein